MRKWIGAAVGVIGLACAQVMAQSRPNVVLILSDDGGFADFGTLSNQPNPKLLPFTKHISQIGIEGARCTNAYVSGAVCSPSRAGLLTGRYQQRFGHEQNLSETAGTDGLPLTEKLIGDRLHPLGYEAGIIGKWHLGYLPEFHPAKRGFDYSYSFLQGSRSYYMMNKEDKNRQFLDNDKLAPEGEYTTDTIGDRAVNYISQKHGKPYFLFVSFNAVHSPMQPRKEDEPNLPQFATEGRRKYAGLMKALDENVGKIMDAVKKSPDAENTLVIFTNDNGGQTLTNAINTPLRGHKGELYEGGVRVPMAFWWPGKIKPGTVIDEPVISLDFFPTIIGLAGGKVESDWKLDGVDLMPRLSGQMEKLSPRPLFWRSGGERGPIAIRDGNWKYIHRRNAKDAKPELYDLSADIAETNDLASTRPEVVKTLEQKLAEWEKGCVQPLWRGIGPTAIGAATQESPTTSETKTNDP